MSTVWDLKRINQFLYYAKCKNSNNQREVPLDHSATAPRRQQRTFLFIFCEFESAADRDKEFFFQSNKIIFFSKIVEICLKENLLSWVFSHQAGIFYPVQKWIRKEYCSAWDSHCSGKITTDKKLMRLAHCFYEKNDYLIARLYSMNISKFGKLSEIPGRNIFSM